MTPDDLLVGVAVRVVSNREIAGASRRDWVGHVWGSYRPLEIPDWCLVKITDGATIIVGFAPDELEQL